MPINPNIFLCSHIKTEKKLLSSNTNQRYLCVLILSSWAWKILGWTKDGANLRGEIQLSAMHNAC